MTINDVSTGFADDQKEAKPPKHQTSLCNRPFKERASHRVYAAFLKGSFGPLIFEEVGGFPSTDSACIEYDDTVKGGSVCTTFGHGKNHPTISALSFPKLGQQTFAVALSFRGGSEDLV